jgi:peptidoglycan/LPS O-acetylase OafA/YrhL
LSAPREPDVKPLPNGKIACQRPSCGAKSPRTGLLAQPVRVVDKGNRSRFLTRYHNFDFLRVAAAVAVIFSHSFLIADGDQSREPLNLLNGNQGVLGLLGVFVFFAISGFLIAQSYETAPSPWRFTVARVLRIFPGLAVCLLVCSLVLGPIVTELGLGEYLRQPKTWLFVIRNLALLPDDEALPGVVFVDNPSGTVVTGTLWSLRYEVYCYLMVLVLGLARRLTLRVAAAIFVLAMLSNVLDLDDAIGARYGAALDHLGIAGAALKEWFDLSGFLWLVPAFAAGMCLYFLRDRGGPRAALAVVALAGFVATVAFGKMLLLFPLFGGYLTLYLATAPGIRLPRIGRFGDFSYGLYIYGWPAEAFTAWLRGGQAPWYEVCAGGLVLGFALAFLSWHLVEKRALRLKPRSPAAGEARVAEGAY